MLIYNAIKNNLQHSLQQFFKIDLMEKLNLGRAIKIFYMSLQINFKRHWRAGQIKNFQKVLSQPRTIFGANF